MAEETEEMSPIATLIVLAGITICGYIGYTTFFPNERNQVRSCITAMLEASRGQVGYGELRDKLAALDAAETVVLVDEKRRDFGDSVLVSLTYETDGRTSRVMCGR